MAQAECQELGIESKLTVRVTEITEGAQEEEAVNNVLFVGAGEQGGVCVQRGCKREQQEHSARHSQTQSCRKAYFHVLAEKDSHSATWTSQEKTIKAIVSRRLEAWLKKLRSAVERASGAGTSGARSTMLGAMAGRSDAPLSGSENPVVGSLLSAVLGSHPSASHTGAAVPSAGVAPELQGSCPVAAPLGSPHRDAVPRASSAAAKRPTRGAEKQHGSGQCAPPLTAVKRARQDEEAVHAVPETDEDDDDTASR